MRVERLASGALKVVLSRRNLLTLLTKMSLGDSACTIGVLTDQGTVFVQSEADSQHYDSRTYAPGDMAPVTEAMIREFDAHEHPPTTTE